MAKRYVLKGAPEAPNHFKAWRQLRGWTQQELADRMETTVAMVSRIEADKRDWGKTYLEAFAHVVGCRITAPITSPPSAADKSDEFLSVVADMPGASLETLAGAPADAPPATDDPVRPAKRPAKAKQA